MKLLVVDDEKLIREVIRDYATLEGYDVDEAESGSDALTLINKNRYDLIIMDIMMPHMDGFTAIKKIKEIIDVPIIILSARKEEIDKLDGFDLGIDDYVTKPFSPRELMARIKAILKRNIDSEEIVVGGITLNKSSYTVSIDGIEKDFTHTQFELLKLFLENPNIALSRERIIESIWGYVYDADDRTIDAHIKLLRSKLGKYKTSIKTVRNVGYKFKYEEE